MCERAGVVPRAVYARVATKEDLFLAVYERGMQRVRASESALSSAPRAHGIDAAQPGSAPSSARAAALVAETVRGLARVFTDNRAFLSAVVLISGHDSEVARRGAEYAAGAGDQFVRALLPVGALITHADPEGALRNCFSDLFAALVLRVAYGPGFVGPFGTDEEHADHLVDLACRYLLCHREGTDAISIAR